MDFPQYKPSKEPLILGRCVYLSSDWSRGGSRPLSLSVARQPVAVMGLAVKFPCRVEETR